MPSESQIKEAIKDAVTESDANAAINRLIGEEERKKRDQDYLWRHEASKRESRSGDEANFFIKCIVFIFSTMVLNLPAIFPAIIITATLYTNVYVDSFEGIILVAINIGTLAFATIFIWQIFRTLLLSIKRWPKFLQYIGYGVFWTYILGCYGGVVYNICVASELSLGMTIFFVAIACLLGAGAATKQMRLIEDDKKE